MRHPDNNALQRLSFIPFPEELVAVKREFMAYAREMGLDPGEVVFDFLTPKQISQAAAYDGFPGRYPHWRFGMAFDRLNKSHGWGLSTIYEMVVNTTPAYAYLLQGSTRIIQKMVIAHVLGHCDFFRHNAWFSRTNRNMLNESANHAARVRRYSDRFGPERVERFLDSCLSLDNLLDPALLFAGRKRAKRRWTKGEEAPEEQVESRFTTAYMDSYSRSVKEGKRPDKEEREGEATGSQGPFPAAPTRGVLDFLVENAPLKDWEKDLLDMIREEAYYFLPQRFTKIMNEGWAVFWHRRIMAERGIEAGEMVAFADEHSKIVAPWPNRLNPYRLGLYLFEDVKKRWDRGMYGEEWENCTDERERREWDKREMKGLQKVLEVRAAMNDVEFIDAFLTPEFAVENGFFTFRKRMDEGVYAIESREFNKIKKSLLSHLANGGEPILKISDANYGNRSELFLEHLHGGVDLKIPEARATLHALHSIWRRPVHIKTVNRERETIYSYDGVNDGER